MYTHHGSTLFSPRPLITSGSTDHEIDPRVRVGIRFIELNYSQPSLRLKHISLSAGLSVWHFSRLFNEHIQMGIPEYLKQVRIRHACVLLQSPALSIKEIAAAVGYAHLSDFYHHFKEQYETSPLIFRRNALNTKM